jgi:hypothetical protein
VHDRCDNDKTHHLRQRAAAGKNRVVVGAQVCNPGPRCGSFADSFVGESSRGPRFGDPGPAEQPGIPRKHQQTHYPTRDHGNRCGESTEIRPSVAAPVLLESSVRVAAQRLAHFASRCPIATIQPQRTTDDAQSWAPFALSPFYSARFFRVTDTPNPLGSVAGVAQTDAGPRRHSPPLNNATNGLVSPKGAWRTTVGTRPHTASTTPRFTQKQCPKDDSKWSPRFWIRARGHA